MTTDTSVRRKVGSRRGHKVNALTFSILCKLMMDGTRTCHELAEESGLHVLTVYDWTRELHRQGVIHICMWDGEGRSSTRIFMFGPGKDAEGARSKSVHKSVQNTALKARTGVNQHDSRSNSMNKTNTGGPAFPAHTIAMHEGMTLRDYFAAKAMQGLTSRETGGWAFELIAERAYEMADAMLKARAA